MGKKQKRKLNEGKEKEAQTVSSIRQSDESVEKKMKWINKQRVLIFASRGINHRDRHLMEDLKKLMPHHKPEAKMERSKTLSIINEMCEIKNCSKAMMFEGRKKRDLYMWLSNVPNGPSVKFLVENIYTMEELKLTGNCLRGSRPLLSFDPVFNEKAQYMLLKELFIQIFGVPKHHPKSQPFFDHVYTFTMLDNRIWFRNFQILSEDGALAEVGPRFVLNPVKIFSGSFGGVTLWENPNYISPSKYRHQLGLKAKNKYVNRIQQKEHAEATRPTESYKLKPLDDIFEGDLLEKAKEYGKKELEENDKKSTLTNRKKKIKSTELENYEPKLKKKKDNEFGLEGNEPKLKKKKLNAVLQNNKVARTVIGSKKSKISKNKAKVTKKKQKVKN